MSRKDEIWKKKSCAMKNLNTSLLSSFMVSTALCTELAPSAPLKARPGPSIPQSDDRMMTISPNPIAAVVVPSYASSTKVAKGKSEILETLNPPYANPASKVNLEALTCKEGSLRSHGVKGGLPEDEFLLPDLKRLDRYIGERRIFECLDHFKTSITIVPPHS